MPLKLKNKLTNQIIDTVQSEKDKYPDNIWQVVYQKGIVFVYEPINGDDKQRRGIGTFEKEDASIELFKNPTYTFERLPDFDLVDLNNAPNTTQTPPHSTNDHAGITLLKKSFTIVKIIFKHNVFKWILNHLWQFLVTVLAGLVIWYYTVIHPILK